MRDLLPRDVKRFWRRVDTSKDCWEWKGCRCVQGYGKFDISRNAKKNLL